MTWRNLSRGSLASRHGCRAYSSCPICAAKVRGQLSSSPASDAQRCSDTAACTCTPARPSTSTRNADGRPSPKLRTTVTKLRSCERRWGRNNALSSARPAQICRTVLRIRAQNANTEHRLTSATRAHRSHICARGLRQTDRRFRARVGRRLVCVGVLFCARPRAGDHPPRIG